MRKIFSNQLIEARQEMLSIFEALDLTLHDAVRAFVTDDTALASEAKKQATRIEARCENLEAVCYNLISMQGPLAADFRILQTVVAINYNLQRICNKVYRIARVAKKKVEADISLPEELTRLIEREAGYVYRVMGLCISALVNNDLAIVRELTERDEPVHEIYKEFFRSFNRMDAEEMVDTEEVSEERALDNLRRTVMVARYLDRIASISIDAASRITFMLTGQRWSLADMAEADDEELEDARIPSGEGVILNPSADARCVSRLPLDEVSEELAELIRQA